MKLWKKSNNRGASLVSVIVAMTVVAVLGVTIMYVAYSNFNMKTVNKKSKDNFYSAERVLDEIASGLEQEMSGEYEKAYITVMEKYGTYTGASEMERDFRTEFILNMVEKLHLPGSENEGEGETSGLTMDNRYSLNKLRSYISGTYAGTPSVGTTGTDTNLLQTVEDGIILRNVSVTYREGGYSNTITTDIKISVPGIEFTKSSSGMIDFMGFAYVADDGIVLTNAAKSTVSGKAYSGSVNNSPAVSLEHDTVLNIENTELFVAGGDIKLVGHAALSGSEDTTIWTNGIQADVSSGATKKAQNTIDILGTTYVADDLTLSGKDNVLTLGGKYIGFSGGITAAQSSALIINGMNTEIDMSELQTLVLAGTAYVSASSMLAGEIGKTNSVDIRTGESIALKSNQVAYLAPTDCEGIRHNPMTYTQGTTGNGEYNQLISDPDWEEKALNSIIPALNRTIASYGNVSITPIFSNEQGGCVYLFLNFTNVSEAAAYFRDVYNCSGLIGKKLRESMQNYLVLKKTTGSETEAAFLMNDSCNIIMNGNYLMSAAFSDEKNAWVSDYIIADKPTGDLTGNLASYAGKYKALCTKLTESTSDMTVNEQNRTVYQNLVDETELRSLVGGTLTNDAATVSRINANTVKFTKSAMIEGNSVDLQAVITDNAGGSAYTVSQPGYGVIIATGDVVVSADWTGTIICGGALRLADNENLKLTADDSITAEAMVLKVKQDGKSETVSPAYVIIGGDSLDSNKSDSSEEDFYDTTDVRNCVTYENWKSE